MPTEHRPGIIDVRPGQCETHKALPEPRIPRLTAKGRESRDVSRFSDDDIIQFAWDPLKELPQALPAVARSVEP